MFLTHASNQEGYGAVTYRSKQPLYSQSEPRVITLVSNVIKCYTVGKDLYLDVIQDTDDANM